MKYLKEQVKRIISIVLIIAMIINLCPNIFSVYATNENEFGEIVLRKGYYNENDKIFSLELCVRDMGFIFTDLTFEYPSSDMEVISYYYKDLNLIIPTTDSKQAVLDNQNETGSTIDYTVSKIDSESGKVRISTSVTCSGGSGMPYDSNGKETVLATIYFRLTNENMELFDLRASMFSIDKESFFSVLNENGDQSNDMNMFKVEGFIEDEEITLQALSIKTNPTAGKTYEHGDSIDLNGGKLIATYTDGTSKEISMTDVTVKTGEKEGAYADINNPTLKLEYEEKTVELDINVIDPVDNIKFYDKNNVLEKYELRHDDDIPTDKLYIKTTTKSGIEKEILLSDEKITLNSNVADMYKVKEETKVDLGGGEFAGIQEITITYKDENVTKTTAFSILVNDIVGEIKISTQNPPETTLTLNDEFEKTGAIEIIGEYTGSSYGEIEISSDDVNVTETDGTAVNLTKLATNKKLKVEYLGKTVNYTINVVDKIETIKVNVPNNYVEVKYGEELKAEDFSGITITEIMKSGQDGETKALDFTWIDTANFNKESLEKQELKINYPYNGKIIEETIAVKAKNELLGITINNLQTEYVYKDELNYEGAELYIEYMSGETGPYEVDETVVTNNFNSGIIGPQEVTFTYSDGIDSVSTKVSVNVARGTLTTPTVGTLEILEDVAISTIENQLPTTEYGSVVWENPAQTLSAKNGEKQQINAIYKMNNTYKQFYQDIPMKVEVTVKTQTLKEVSLKTEPKLQYYEGQTFDTTGLELNVKYEDGTTAILAGGYDIEGIELDKPLTIEDNGKTISIKYKDFDPIQLTLTVNPDVVVGIELNTEAAKTVYKYNEELDLSNITVKKVMASGIAQDAVNVKDNAEVTVSDNYDKTNITAKQTITIQYAGFEKSYIVEVKDYVAKIELPEETKLTLEKEYLYGDIIKLTDSQGNALNIHVYMASDMENPITEEILSNMIYANMTQLGAQQAIVKYKEAETTFNITVKDYVSEIEIVNQPTKRIYKIGETLELAGLIVRDVMASEATKEAGNTTLTQEQYEVSTLDSSVTGLKTITITRKDLSVAPITFNVLVVEENENLEVQINELPKASTYYGKDIDLTGGSIIVKPEGESEGTIISMTDGAITVEGYNKNQKGEQIVTLIYTYQESTAEGLKENTLKVELPIVVQDYRIDQIKLTSQPSKLTYKFGEDLNLTGGEVARLMASGVEFAKTPLTMQMISGFNQKQEGVQTITVTYQNLTTTFNVTVVDNIYGISMNSNPDKTTYKHEEELNLEGATIKVEKDSGTHIIPVTSDMVTGYDKTKAGEQLVTVKYKGFETQFTVNVEKKAVAPEKDETVVNKAEYLVIFKDYDGTILKREYVKQGEKANPPQVGIREGYKFIGWDKEYSNVQKDIVITAQYQLITIEEPESPESPETPATQKPTQTLGEKDKMSNDSKIKDTLIPGLIGLAITGALLLIITSLTKKNVEVYAITEERKLVAKYRMSKKERTLYLDEYKEELDVAEIELVIGAKTAQKLDGEQIKVILNGQEKSYTIHAKNEENVIINVK